MDIDHYAEWTAQAVPTGHEPNDLALMALSLVGDTGEVAEVIKKSLRDGVLDRGRLAHELSDVIFYWVQLCAVARVKPSELLDQSRISRESRLTNTSAIKP